MTTPKIHHHTLAKRRREIIARLGLPPRKHYKHETRGRDRTSDETTLVLGPKPMGGRAPEHDLPAHHRSLAAKVADECDIPYELAFLAVSTILASMTRALGVDRRPLLINGFGSIVLIPNPSHSKRRAEHPRFSFWYPGCWPRLPSNFGRCNNPALFDTWARAIDTHRRRRDRYRQPDPDLLP